MKKDPGFVSIALERMEQVTKHKHSLSGDRLYTNGQLLFAASFCLTLDDSKWPDGWSTEQRDRIKLKSYVERAVIAGAFIAAEVDRLREIDPWEFDRAIERYSEWTRLGEFVKQKESALHTHYSGSLVERAFSVVNHYEREAATATARKLKLIEDMKIFVRAFSMSTESVAMAGTHGEKAARLRGLIELLNHTAEKLEQGQEDDLLNAGRFMVFARSEYPYESILRKYDDLKRENEELKQRLVCSKPVSAAVDQINAY